MQYWQIKGEFVELFMSIFRIPSLVKNNPLVQLSMKGTAGEGEGFERDKRNKRANKKIIANAKKTEKKEMIKEDKREQDEEMEEGKSQGGNSGEKVA